ncbi:MAG: YceI family protein [Aromatoleum sp.]|nr:YceI family protein [Aromatoleum sp.]
MRFVVAASALALAASAAAQASLVVDSLHTGITFEMGALGIALQRGSFARTAGRIVLDRAAKTGSIDVAIDAGSLKAGSAAREAQLKGDAWLDAARYSSIAFRSTRLVFDGDRVVGADGELTLHGVTRPVSLAVTAFRCIDVHPLTRKPACGAEATATIRRSDYGLSADLATLADAVSVRVAIEALQE